VGAEGAGHRRCDGVKAGDELGHHHRLRPPFAEIVFRLADAVVGRQGNLAQQLEDALAEAASGAEPEHVADQASQHGHAQHHRERRAAIDGQRSGHDQDRIGGNRQPHLFHQHDGKDDQDTILLQQGDEVSHSATMVAQIGA
jgi:hypothetical protein